LSCNNIIFFKLIQPRQKALAGPGVYEARERVSGAGKVAPGGILRGSGGSLGQQFRAKENVLAGKKISVVLNSLLLLVLSL
jgi:hypothetical protein